MDFLHCWAVVLGQIFRQIISIRVMTLINTNVVASRHIKREEVLLPVAVRHSKTPELKLNFICGNKNITHSAQGETAFLGGIFCLEYPSRCSEKVTVYFANYRFSFRVVPFRFANYSKPKETIILSDINIDFHHKRNYDKNRLVKGLCSMNFKQLTTHPRRARGRSRRQGEV